MWRHITGVEQPVKKIKLDNNENHCNDFASIGQ
jgi:hypothetical protein